MRLWQAEGALCPMMTIILIVKSMVTETGAWLRRYQRGSEGFRIQPKSCKKRFSSEFERCCYNPLTLEVLP